jgi:hypothetical protein
LLVSVVATAEEATPVVVDDANELKLVHASVDFVL